MLARLRKAKENGESGFTLIELLVVMIIIGILAAIAIPVFLSQRTKAQDTATKADASTMGKEIATWFVDNTAAPFIGPVGTSTAENYSLGAATPGVNVGNRSTNVVMGALTVSATAALIPTTWCVPFTNSQPNTKTFVYSAAGGLQTGTCAAGLRVAPTA